MKTKLMRVPILAFENFKKKQEKLQKETKTLFGKPRKIPLTRIMLKSSEQPLFLDNIDIRRLTKWRKI